MERVNLFSLLFMATPMALALLCLPAQAKEPNRAYEVRYTTGAVTNAGWERTLCDGDPNLKRWNWSAMTSYTQSYKRFAPGAFKKDDRKEPGGVYVKPVHLPPIVNDRYRPAPAQIVVGNKVTTGLSGRVRTPHDSKVVAHNNETKVLTYGDLYGRISPVTANAVSEKRDVFGKLMRATP
ncbi:MAG: hypothetical protein K2W82_14965 [Candidatus Obscuribacterales bacterium]|nr:hypothetical protein [Candidatus Obscuribacterales bacterium]